MKRVIAAIIMLLISVVFSFISNYIIIKESDSLTDSLNELMILAKNGTEIEIQNKIKSVNIEWNKNKWIFFSFSSSDDIAKTDTDIQMLSFLYEQKSENEFYETCMNIYNNISSINESEKLSFENIF